MEYPEMIMNIWQMNPAGDEGHGDGYGIEIDFNLPKKPQITKEIMEHMFGFRKEEITWYKTEESINQWITEEVPKGYDYLYSNDIQSIYLAKVKTEWGYYEFELEIPEPEGDE